MRFKSTCDGWNPADSQEVPDSQEAEKGDTDSEKTLCLDDFAETEEKEGGLTQQATPDDFKEMKPAEEVTPDLSKETGEFFGRKMKVAYGPGYGPGSLDGAMLQTLLGGLMDKTRLKNYVGGFEEHLAEAAASSSQKTPDQTREKTPEKKPAGKSVRKKKGTSSKGKTPKKWSLKQQQSISHFVEQQLDEAGFFVIVFIAEKTSAMYWAVFILCWLTDFEVSK